MAQDKESKRSDDSRPLANDATARGGKETKLEGLEGHDTNVERRDISG